MLSLPRNTYTNVLCCEASIESHDYTLLMYKLEIFQSLFKSSFGKNQLVHNFFVATQFLAFPTWIKVNNSQVIL